MAELIKGGLKHLRRDPTKARGEADIKYLSGSLDRKLYRLRVGDYRAIYWLNEERREVLVEKITPRKKAYNKIP